MRRTLTTLAVVIGLGCGETGEPASIDDLVRSLQLDSPVDLDVDCPPIPAEAERILIAGVFQNSPPIRPGSADFPADFCPSNTIFYADADGHGDSSILGEFAWSERYCVVAGSDLIAQGYFAGRNGDRIEWDAHIRPDSVPPPIPFATFSGSFTFTDGTGAFAGAHGEATVFARQLGDATPGRPAGTTAAALCGWIVRSGERG
jgi:hypothetical protein